jgi:hypothetical protein
MKRLPLRLTVFGIAGIVVAASCIFIAFSEELDAAVLVPEVFGVALDAMILFVIVEGLQDRASRRLNTQIRVDAAYRLKFSLDLTLRGLIDSLTSSKYTGESLENAMSYFFRDGFPDPLPLDLLGNYAAILRNFIPLAPQIDHELTGDVIQMALILEGLSHETDPKAQVQRFTFFSVAFHAAVRRLETAAALASPWAARRDWEIAMSSLNNHGHE